MKWLVLLTIEADTINDAFAKADELLAEDFGGSDFDLFPARDRDPGDPLPHNLSEHLTMPRTARPNKEES